MKLTIEPTRQITFVDGVPSRVWEGRDERGTAVTLFVAIVAVSKDEPPEAHAAFERELEEVREPSMRWPTHMKR